MSGIASRNGLTFSLFPAYAKFLSENRLEEFVKVSFEISLQEEMAIMKLLKDVPEAQLFELGRTTVKEMLDAIAANETEKYINHALEQWLTNQLPLISRDEIISEDITTGAFVRRRVFRHFVKEYSNDENLAILIMEEVDRFTTVTELVTYDAYIRLQKEKLEEKNAELIIREQQLLEAQTIAEMGSFVWHLTDPAKSVYTPQMMKIFGMEKTGKLEDFLLFVHPDDRGNLKTALDNALKNGQRYQCEYRYNRNGEEIHLDSKGIVELENGIPVKMRGTVRDITKKHRMLKQLRDLNDDLSAKNAELERSNKELESFNYIASHDLQEPLRKIQTFSSRLLEHPESLPENIADYLERINASSIRMKALIEDLLSFSQIVSPEEAFDEVDLNEILNDVKNNLSDILEANRVTIHTTTPLPSIKAISFQFSQLFVNLITNSIKYKKSTVAPEITISAKRGSMKNLQDCLILSVSDNGIGFDPEYNERVFDLFKRLHAREKYSGTGIGLSICKKIVQNHGGIITASGTEGLGATFTICVPKENVIEPSVI